MCSTAVLCFTQWGDTNIPEKLRERLYALPGQPKELAQAGGSNTVPRENVETLNEEPTEEALDLPEGDPVTETEV